MPMARTWNGMDIQAKVARANGRAIVGMGMQVARDTKLVTHVLSGTLRRSVHAAPAGYQGYEEDEQRAVSEDLMSTEIPNASMATVSPLGHSIEVGSWLRYACAEWVGRGHPGVTQGLEAARPGLFRYIHQAFREEGL